MGVVTFCSMELRSGENVETVNVYSIYVDFADSVFTL